MFRRLQNVKLLSFVRCYTNVRKIRNVGIIAHIDAGKTTLTERMLYYSGYLQSMGEVHTGDTVMDHTAQERERGITISSASITFPWRDCRINLIDTPGHVDFTMEVERSLRVLDGAIVLLDGSAGVEAQTMTVWRQAQRKRLPCIAFVNKMDKINADLDMTLESMRTKLGLEPLLIQVPVDDSQDHYKRTLDIVRMEEVQFDIESKGSSVTRIPIDETHQQYEKTCSLRTQLVEKLGDFDDEIAELFLNDAKVSIKDLESALRRATLSSKAIVTLAGSAYKNSGVQPLMDAISDILPNPLETRQDFLANLNMKKDLCAMAFKIEHHPTKGVLTYVRLYSGKLCEGATIFNKTRDCAEKVSRIATAYSDDFKPIKEVECGDIAVLGGLKETITGDTLVSSMKFANSHSDLNLPGVEVPDPVFFCSIEAPSLSKQKALEQALRNLTREDPSLRLQVTDDENNNSDQTILSGMGELHLQVILSKIRKDYRIDADLGPLMVAYKEAPDKTVNRKTVEFYREIAGKSYSITIELTLIPILQSDDKQGKQKSSLLTFSNHKDDMENIKTLKPWQFKALEKGFQNSLSNGPVLNFPVLYTSVKVHKVVVTGKPPEVLLIAAMNNAVKSTLKEADTCLLEPVMKLVVNIENEAINTVINDLLLRGGEIIERQDLSGFVALSGYAPLRTLRGYSTHVRIISSGKAFFGMEFSHYQRMDLASQNEAVKEVTGFSPSS